MSGSDNIPNVRMTLERTNVFLYLGFLNLRQSLHLYGIECRSGAQDQAQKRSEKQRTEFRMLGNLLWH